MCDNSKTHKYCMYNVDVSDCAYHLIDEPCEFCETQPHHYIIARDGYTRTSCCWDKPNVPE